MEIRFLGLVNKSIKNFIKKLKKEEDDDAEKAEIILSNFSKYLEKEEVINITAFDRQNSTFYIRGLLHGIIFVIVISIFINIILRSR